MAETIFQRCGGFATVRKVVSAFYDKVLDEENLQQYFNDVDMRRLIDHQTKFIASMMGGPASFSNDALQRVHATLGISHDDYLLVAGLLRETLEDFEIERGDIEVVYREIMSRESLIVTRRG